MQGILCSDWLPERDRWAYFARSGFPALVRQGKNLSNNFPETLTEFDIPYQIQDRNLHESCEASHLKDYLFTG